MKCAADPLADNEPSERKAAVTVNEMLSAVAVETASNSGGSAEKITLAALLFLAREKNAFETENFQLQEGWNKKTREKAKRVIGKMKDLMDETEKRVLVLDQVPQGEAFEEWKSKFKAHAMAVQTKFMLSLASRYDDLKEHMMDVKGLSRNGEPYFIGAANRDAGLVTAENKLKMRQEDEEHNQQQRMMQDKAKEDRLNFFSRGKVHYK